MDSPIDSESDTEGRSARDLEAAIDAQTRRRIRSLRGEQRGVLFWVGMFGLVGWSVAVPTLLGTFLGIYLDRRWPSSISWTLTLLFAGLILGCLTAWRWMRTESQELQSENSRTTETENKKQR